MGKQSIQDIAKALNISITTVSMVLNGKADKYKISKKTQAKIKDYIEKTHYVPNIHARGLSSGKSFCIGYVVPDIANPFYARIGRVIEDQLDKAGYQLMSGSYDEDPNKENRVVDNLLARQVDGIILAASGKNIDLLSRIKEAGVPVVLFDRFLENDNIPFVGVNNREIVSQSISEFIQKGLRNIALVSTNTSVQTIIDRNLGFVDAFKKANISVDEDLVIEVSHRTMKEELTNRFQEIFSKGKKLDAVFFINNICALNGMWVLRRSFENELQNIQLLSFDDIEFFEFSSPAISGIAQPRQKIAEKCSELILEVVQNSKQDSNKYLLEAQVNWRA